MARLKGLEPLTHCLEGSCSIHLSYRRILERVMGIEPTRPAWKAGILPLNYTRIACFLRVSLHMIAQFVFSVNLFSLVNTSFSPFFRFAADI